MFSTLQEGIYYRKKPSIGHSFCMISLRANSSTKIDEIGRSIAEIWKCISKLKNGITTEFHTDKKNRKIGNLTSLIAYGPKIFDIDDSKKIRPVSFSDNWTFKHPDREGGGTISDGSGIAYSSNVFENHLLSDHIIIQFVGDIEFYTNRAVVEVWRELIRLEKDSGYKPLSITGIYSGFQREDKRNWLGFHDGVSNLKSQERTYVISINRKHIPSEDRWIENGTYLAFMRIITDLQKWQNFTRREQEIIIGRDKTTGCPLDVDKNGNFTKVRGCPVLGTSEVIDPGNERFRDHPPYRSTLLQYSHVEKTRPIDRIPVWDKKSSRIYRQGFEFLETLKNPFAIRPGLNFISFQNTPERLFRALSYSFNPRYRNIIAPQTRGLEDIMSVDAAGIFLVPPSIKYEPFPGSKIFGLTM